MTERKTSVWLVAACVAASLLAVFEAAGSGQVPAAVSEETFAGLRFRAIGPATFSGRITDLAVFEPNPSIYYVGTPGGGLWKTTNNGTTWEVLFSDLPNVVSIGDVAIAPTDHNVVWVGTGEAENFQCSTWGNGVYRSADGGRTWKHLGLSDTKHIGRILIDPADHDVVYVAAAGHFWGANKERGVFKTTDGGATWKNVLFVDEDTGAIDVLMDPSNSQVLYAVTYQRRRAPWGMNGGGPGSGFHKSTDGGATWRRLTDGLPEGPLGRLGLDIYPKNPSILYAIVEHPGGRDVYRSDNRGASWRKMTDPLPSYMGHRLRFFSMIRVDPNNDLRVYVTGVNINVSEDGGRTFRTESNALQSGFWPATTWGYLYNTRSDHRTLWIDPRNSDHLISGTDGGVFISWDRAKTWEMIDNMDLGEYYRVGFDMDTPYRVYGGMQDNRSWGGPNAVRSYLGIGNGEWFLVGPGDGFSAMGDPKDSRVLYAESQYGNIDRVDRLTNERKSIKPEGEGGESLRWNWDTPIAISPHDSNTIYAAANRVFRSRNRGNSWTAISPDLTQRTDPRTLSLMGVAGKDFRLGSASAASYGTIVSFAESPKRAGIYYTGSDDGTVQVSRDAGKTWTNITDRFPGLPKGTWVAKVAPSGFDESAAYAAFDGHRENDYTPYVYVSSDYGSSWRSIGGALPKGFVVRSFAEDLRNPNVLYAGTEFGLFASIDRGATWTRLKSNLPTVPIFDMALHPRENDLILGTHGRSIWILDDLTPIQQAADALRTDAYLFDIRPATTFNPANDREWMWGAKRFWGQNPPFGAMIAYYLKETPKELTITVRDASGALIREIAGGDLDARVRVPGVNRVQWNLRHAPLRPPVGTPPAEQGMVFFLPEAPRAHVFQQIAREELEPLNGPFVLPGEYTVTLNVNGRTAGTRSVTVKGDPLIPISEADRRILHDTGFALHHMQRTAQEVAQAVMALVEQVGFIEMTLTKAAQVPDEVKIATENVSGRIAALRRAVEPPQGQGADRPDSGANLLGRLSALKIRIGGSTSRPTDVQMRRAATMRQELDTLVAETNTVITVRMPDLYTALGKHNIRPAPPAPIKTIATSSAAAHR